MFSNNYTQDYDKSSIKNSELVIHISKIFITNSYDQITDKQIKV